MKQKLKKVERNKSERKKETSNDYIAGNGSF